MGAAAAQKGGKSSDGRDALGCCFTAPPLPLWLYLKWL